MADARLRDKWDDAEAEASARDDAEAEASVREHTDEALALEFARRHARHMRYVDGWSKWMLYDGAVWAPDETLTVFSNARALCRDDAAAAPAKERARILSAKTVAAIVIAGPLGPGACRRRRPMGRRPDGAQLRRRGRPARY